MPTIAKIARTLGVCPSTVKGNVTQFFRVMTIEERVLVMEHMIECRKPKGGMRKVKLILDDLPVTKDPTNIEEFLGVTKDDLWRASQLYEKKMKTSSDPHDAFNLNQELIVEMAEEVAQRNVQWLVERFDPKNPIALLETMADAPVDKPEWILRLMRRHGFTQVDLSTWVAADMFLMTHVKQHGVDAASRVIGKALGR